MNDSYRWKDSSSKTRDLNIGREWMRTNSTSEKASIDRKTDWIWVRFILTSLLFILLIGFGGYHISTNILGHHYDIERQHSAVDDSRGEILNIINSMEMECKAIGASTRASYCDEPSLNNDYILTVLNLASQRRATELSEGSLDVAIIQIWLTVAAFVLLSITVYQTSQGLLEARNAAKDARDTLDAAIKKDSPYIRFLCFANPNDHEKGKCRVQAGIQNIGQSAALNVHHSSRFIWREGDVFQTSGGQSQGPTNVNEIVPFEKDQKIGMVSAAADFIDMKRLLSEESRLYLMLNVSYETIFNNYITKRTIYRIAPISMELISYRQQLKLLEIKDNNFSKTTEEIEIIKSAAENPENVIKVDIYECNDSLYSKAEMVTEEHNSNFEDSMGIAMPNIGTPDQDE